MMRRQLKGILALSIVVSVYVSASVGAQTGLLRFPAIHEGQIVFTYAGDLYTVKADGGVARKLTSHAGFEMFARFSPDGQSLAFTGQYDGNTEVYLMPAAGGVPQRVTYTPTLSRDDVSDRMGPNNIVMTWTPDGDIVFRSRMRSFNSFNGRLYSVSPSGHLPDELPLPRAGFCSFSPNGKQLAYNRIFREFRTWKRYRGGMADDVWVYDIDSKGLQNVTDNPAQDIIPMWHGDKIYFLSDRDANKRMNLFVYDTQSQETRQLTEFVDFDIKFPSLGKQAIVFENGGYIYRYDLKSNKHTKVDISIREDLAGGRTELTGVSENVTNYAIAPDGNRALLGARGDVFTVPAKHGEIRNLTHSPGVHDRNSIWSPDGKWIAYISDATGEDEIWVMPQDGSTPARQVTKNAETYKYQITWSPDSRKILWGDKRLRLRFVNVKSGRIRTVDTSERWEFRDYAWSPDSRWIVYSRAEMDTLNKIMLYSLPKKQSFELTKGWYGASNPRFSADGRFVFFVSDRDFNPIYGNTEWNHVYQDMSRIYLLTLAKATKSPFEPKSDEVEVKQAPAQTKKKQSDKKKVETTEQEKVDQKKTEKTADKKPSSKKPKRETIKVDIDGITDRIAVLPVPVARYAHLVSVDDQLYYLRRSSKSKGAQLCLYNLKEQKETELGTLSGYELSANGKKMLVASGGKYAIVDRPKGKVEMKDVLDLSGMEVNLDRHAEWQQIFNECWRQMREFFYVPNMHGVDWPALRERYASLLPYVNHRMDLTYVIGEMISELNVGHAYVGGGESPKPRRIAMGLLGAELERDATSGTYRIAKILRGQNWDKTLRSPLTEIGVDAKEGDYILAVNGQSTAEIDNIYQLLINKVGKQVTLRLNSNPEDEGSRKVTVIPTASQSQLYYYGWVQDNIHKVSAATDGEVGYIHVPDMGRTGLNEFMKHYYPQIRKKALIIDVRGNGGGNVSPMLIERLRREIVMIDFSRNTGPSTDPGAMLYGPLVCLADEFSASDGDLFTYRFKKHKMGQVVGKRTWGGVVGIRGSLPLLDGGTLNKPEFSRYDVEGKDWIIEGIGVDPDIYVDNDPAQEYAGIDQQLNRAIEVILEELQTKEKDLPGLPPYPVR